MVVALAVAFSHADARHCSRVVHRRYHRRRHDRPAEQPRHRAQLRRSHTPSPARSRSTGAVRKASCTRSTVAPGVGRDTDLAGGAAARSMSSRV